MVGRGAPRGVREADMSDRDEQLKRLVGDPNAEKASRAGSSTVVVPDPDRASTTTVLEAIVLGGFELRLERPSDAEGLIDEQAFEADEFLPYWAERWPSGVAAERASTFGHGRVLELGCGLGLPSLVAALRGAEVVATDWSEDAIALLEQNARRNGAELTAVTRDWRNAESFVPLGPFDLVLAADVLYEDRNATPILALLEVLGCAAILADPGRPHTDAFFATVRERGWVVEVQAHDALPRGGIHDLYPP